MATEKILNTRIQLKIDTLENWKNSTLKIKNGEVCFATVAAEVGTGLEEPVVMMKVGTSEEKTFSELPWAFYAKSSDVLAACKTEEGLTAFVNSVIADAGIASDDAMQALAGKVTTAEGKITALEGKMATAEGKITTAEAAIATLNELVGDTAVDAQIDAKIAALNLADTYAAKVHGHVIADVDGLEDRLVAAKKAGDDAAAALGTYKTLNDAAVKVNSDAITAIKDGTAIDSFADVEAALAGKQAAGDYSVVGHKHEIADVNGLSDAIADAKKAGTDAATAAANALTDAKKYADDEIARLVGDETVDAQIAAVLESYTNTTDMNSAIATAKCEAVEHANGLNTAMNARVEALEAIDHSHTFVESELNLIQAGDVAKWNAAEQNAKDYADGLDEAMDGRVAALEAKFTGDDSVAGQIAAAVSAEATLRDDADKALQALIEANDDDILALQGLVGDETVEKQVNDAVAAEAEIARAAEKANADAIKAIKDDYLTSVEEKALQDQITANANAIELLTNGVSADEVDGVNDLIQYVKDHGAEVTGIKKDIGDNATAIGALDTRIGAAETAIGTKAAQADLEALTGRVATVEGDLNTATTGLKARMTAAEGEIDALQGLVGDTSVDAQIDAALKVEVDGVKVEKYALATDLAATEQTHADDKAALEDEIAKKANDADLAAIAKTGSTDDLVQGAMVLVFDCGGAGV